MMTAYLRRTESEVKIPRSKCTYILSKEACFISIIKLDDLKWQIEFSKIASVNDINTLISVSPKS